MAKGKKTGGRKKGAKNKRTQELLDKAQEGGMTPLQYMLQVMRDESVDPQRRDDMAKFAAPYLHAKRIPETGDARPAAPFILAVNVDPLARLDE